MSKELLQQLRDKGITVWSFSRLSTANQCEYEYYNTYVLKKRGKNNVYGITGSMVHDYIENLIKGENKIEHFTEKFQEQLAENELLGLDFPNEQIKDNFVKDVTHFTQNFKKPDGQFLLEKLILFQIGEGHWMQGYIDAIQVVEDEKGDKQVNIVDWKSSSKFTGQKLISAGKQLLFYKHALESSSKAKINKLMWCMLKYLYVCHMQKNGKVKYKMCNRGKWVKEMKSTFEKEMLKLGMDDLEVDILLTDAVNNNSIENLPQEIKDKYWLEDCYVEYEPTDENMRELEDYVNTTVAKIESKDVNNPSDWKPLDIEKESFYCNNLCSHRESCSFRKEYIASQNFEKKSVDDVLKGLFD